MTITNNENTIQGLSVP